jgi:hypothetical protein
MPLEAGLTDLMRPRRLLRSPSHVAYVAFEVLLGIFFSDKDLRYFSLTFWTLDVANLLRMAGSNHARETKMVMAFRSTSQPGAPGDRIMNAFKKLVAAAGLALAAATFSASAERAEARPYRYGYHGHGYHGHRYHGHHGYPRYYRSYPRYYAYPGYYSYPRYYYRSYPYYHYSYPYYSAPYYPGSGFSFGFGYWD